MRIAIVSLLLLVTIATNGVGRVGGGRVSSVDSKFEMQLPEGFHNQEQIGNLVLAHGPIAFQPGGPIHQSLQVRDFVDHFSRLKEVSRKDTIADMVGNGWVHTPSAANDCVEIFKHANDTAVGWVATWGAGRGVTLSGPRTALVEYALEQSLNELRLLEGACAWK